MQLEVDIQELVNYAERFILEKYHVKVKLRPVLIQEDIKNQWEELLEVVAKALGHSIETYTSKSRYQPYVFMRHIAAKLIKVKYPGLPDSEIAARYGKHPTTITWGIGKCDNLLEAKDEEFTAMYKAAADAVEKWDMYNKTKEQ